MFSYESVKSESLNSQYDNDQSGRLFSSPVTDPFFDDLVIDDPVIIDKIKIQEILDMSVYKAYARGRIQADEYGSVFPYMLYPFPLRHVLCVYTHKKNTERGVWFHLIDGSIWNDDGNKEALLTSKDFVCC